MLKKILENKGYTGISLYQGVVGHLHADVVIDGIVANFILDTGAANTVIDKEFAEKNNLIFKKTKMLGGGVGTSQLSVFKLNIALFQIAAFNLKKFKLYVVDLQHVKALLEKKDEPNIPYGVIGADILIPHKAIIDYPDHRLYLR